MDRYRRALAHLFLNDGTWAQGEMLKQGFARVYSFADNRSIVKEMLAAEYQARNNNHGIWALDFYKIKPQKESGIHTNSFQVVSARILDVAEVRNNTYLNFGNGYRSDFNIVVPNRAKKMFEQQDINLANLEGKNIFVRDWLKYYNGPSIDLTHPEQLTIQ
jgi:micrococcal nuclease